MESNYDKPVNIGSDRLVTINQLADMIIKISRKKITKTYDLKAPQGVRGRNADLTLVKKEINWEPKITLEDGLQKTYKWIETKVNEDKKPKNK
jgi:nucleoside-diphosphate-sugar epimerase